MEMTTEFDRELAELSMPFSRLSQLISQTSANEKILRDHLEKMKNELNERIDDAVEIQKRLNETLSEAKNLIIELSKCMAKRSVSTQANEEDTVNHPESEELQMHQESENVQQSSNVSGEKNDQIKPKNAPEWLMEVSSRKSPYLPQIEDEVVYLRQAHEDYIKTVEQKQLYPVTDSKDKPWTYLANLGAHEYARVKKVSYQLESSRVCELQLERLNDQSEPTGEYFEVRFGLEAIILEFLLLRDIYDVAIARTWDTGSKFRSYQDNIWRFGTVVAVRPYNKSFSNSHFKRLYVEWDDGKYEEMSSWDLEPIDKKDQGNRMETQHTKLSISFYIIKPSDWPWGSENTDSRYEKLIKTLEKFQAEPYGKPFFSLHADHNYHQHVAYPIDLQTIKSRLENKYYRRLAALQFDIEQMRDNVRNVEDEVSDSSKSLKINKDSYELVYAELKKIIDSKEEENVTHNEDSQNNPDDTQNEDQPIDTQSEYQPIDTQSEYQPTDTQSEYQPTISELPSDDESLLSSLEPRKMNRPPMHWISACKNLINKIWKHRDSKPFRYPIDENKYPDYRKEICSPISLNEIKEYLDTGAYPSCTSFLKDMDRIFENSRKFNTNERSIIYKNTETLERYYNKLKIKVNSSSQSPKKNQGFDKSSPKSKISPSKRKINSNEENSSGDETSVIGLIKRTRRTNDDQAGPSGLNHSRSYGNAFFNSEKVETNQNSLVESDDTSSESESMQDDERDGDCSYNEKTKNNSKKRKPLQTRQAKAITKKKSQNTREKTEPVEWPPFTSEKDLKSIQIGNCNVRVIGQVAKIDILNPSGHHLLKYVIECENNKRVQIKAWEDTAEVYEHKIKSKQIIEIRNAKAVEPYIFDHNDFKYQLLLKESTEIRVYSKRTKKWTPINSTLCNKREK